MASAISTSKCCDYYLKQCQTGRGAVDLPAFRGSGYSSPQQGHGWFSTAWSKFIFPHIVSPLFKDYIVPKAKGFITKKVLPSVKKGFLDFRGDINAGAQSKPSLKKRAGETWARIKSQDGSGRKRSKRSKSL